MHTLTHPETGHQIARADVILWSLVGGIFYAGWRSCWRTVAVLLLAWLLGLTAAPHNLLSLVVGWLVYGLATALLILAELRVRGYQEPGDAKPRKTAPAVAPPQRALAEPDAYWNKPATCPGCLAEVIVAPRPGRFRCPHCSAVFPTR